MIDALSIPFVILREDFHVEYASKAVADCYGPAASDVVGENFFAREHGWEVPELQSSAKRVLDGDELLPEFEMTRDFLGLGARTVSAKFRAIYPGDKRRILIGLEDITARKFAEQAAQHEQERLQTTLRVETAKLEEANSILQAEIAGRVQMETALHQSETALLQSREELRHLSASLMNAQDAERRRVSRELHDDLSQKVAKLQFEAEFLEQKVPFSDLEAARKQLRGVSKQAATLSDDLRRVAHQLHPATLDHLGLSVALRSYTEEFSESTGIEVKFTSMGVPRDTPINLASGLYRIVQEALRNVAKHAGDAAVEIALTGSPRGIALKIRDNGNGFDLDLARSKGGLGLISMQERVRLLDGKFSLETKPGRGLLISIECPLPVAVP